MITSFLLYLASLIVLIMLAPFEFLGKIVFNVNLTATIVGKTQEIFVWLLSPLGYFSGILPVSDIVWAISVLILFYSWIYFIRFVFWIISLIPTMHDITLPFGDEKKDSRIVIRSIPWFGRRK